MAHHFCVDERATSRHHRHRTCVSVAVEQAESGRRTSRKVREGVLGFLSPGLAVLRRINECEPDVQTAESWYDRYEAVTVQDANDAS